MATFMGAAASVTAGGKLTEKPKCEFPGCGRDAIVQPSTKYNLCQFHTPLDMKGPANCEVCGEPATRVISGRDLCNVHGEGDKPMRRAA